MSRALCISNAQVIEGPCGPHKPLTFNVVRMAWSDEQFFIDDGASRGQRKQGDAMSVLEMCLLNGLLVVAGVAVAIFISDALKSKK